LCAQPCYVCHNELLTVNECRSLLRATYANKWDRFVMRDVNIDRRIDRRCPISRSNQAEWPLKKLVSSAIIVTSSSVIKYVKNSVQRYIQKNIAFLLRLIELADESSAIRASGISHRRRRQTSLMKSSIKLSRTSDRPHSSNAAKSIDFRSI